MKRLIKAFRSTSDSTIVQFVETWFHRHSSISGDYALVEEVYGENPDCAFSGTAFRFMEFEPPYDMDDPPESDDQNAFVQYAYDSIRPIKEICSFSVSKNGVEYYTQTEYPQFGAIISANVNGIYLPQLVEKHKDELKESGELDGRVMDSIAHEDEVVVFEPVNNYEVVALIVDYEIRWLK